MRMAVSRLESLRLGSFHGKMGELANNGDAGRRMMVSRVPDASEERTFALWAVMEGTSSSVDPFA